MISGWMKIGLLLLSQLGYWEYFRAKHKISVYFVPVFTVSVQFSVLFAAGLLNCLEEATVFLHGFGFFLLLREVSKNKLSAVSSYITGGHVFFILTLMAIGVLVRDQMFGQIDNFTHWATVVRSMLSTDGFPTFRDTVIEFSSYPLGSSALIYFICKFIGETEGLQMWAQAYLMLCALLPVFVCCKHNQSCFLALAIVMTRLLLNYNIPVTELLVDTLMPLAGMATAWFIVCYCTDREDSVTLSPYYAIPLLIWTMNIKHAALFFVLLGLVLLYLCLGKTKQGRKQWLIIAAVVIFANVLWSRHCDYVFDGASFSRHSLSINWFRTILGDKTTEGIMNTVKMVLVNAVTRTECLWLLAWLLVLGILVWVAVKADKKRYIVFLISIFAVYGAYTVGIMAMYVFSMEEYDTLLAFTRYMRSVDVAIYYMLLLFSGQLLGRFSKKIHAVAVCAVLVTLTAADWYWQTGENLKEQLVRCPKEWRQSVEEILHENELQHGKSYLLCVDENDYNWPRRLWRYNQISGEVDQIVVKDASQLQNEKNYDYVILMDGGNPILEDWVQEHYPHAAESKVIEHFVETSE